jgi:hypothetical protein
MKNPVFVLLSLLVMLSLACSITINIPTTKVGEKQTLAIQEDYPDLRPAELVLRMGGGKLTLQGGSQHLVEGTVEYNITDWKPTISRDGREVRIEQKVVGSIPSGGNVINDWNLRLGNQPLDLTIEAGAYEGKLDLTGVPLVRLKISDGAGQADLVFSAPNPVRMDSLTYETGASNIKLKGLGNTDADVINFRGGAGNFSLDFSGQLKREMRVYVDGGLGNITLRVPKTSNSRIILSSSLNTISTEGTWVVNDNEYRTTGEGPLLRIEVKVGVGNLNLISE